MSICLTLYSRPGCHLCDDVYSTLLALAPDLDLQVSKVDITRDPELLRRFRHLIPVIDIDNGPLLTPPLTTESILTALGETQQ